MTTSFSILYSQSPCHLHYNIYQIIRWVFFSHVGIWKNRCCLTLTCLKNIMLDSMFYITDSTLQVTFLGWVTQLFCSTLFHLHVKETCSQCRKCCTVNSLEWVAVSYNRCFNVCTYYVHIYLCESEKIEYCGINHGWPYRKERLYNAIDIERAALQLLHKLLINDCEICRRNQQLHCSAKIWHYWSKRLTLEEIERSIRVCQFYVKEQFEGPTRMLQR